MTKRRKKATPYDVEISELQALKQRVVELHERHKRETAKSAQLMHRQHQIVEGLSQEVIRLQSALSAERARHTVSVKAEIIDRLSRGG